MSLSVAIFLGLVQGITEFFPVSSSGHLKLAEHLLGLGYLEEALLFDVICHIGTLAAIVVILWRDIRHLLVDRHRMAMVVTATLPLVPLAFLAGLLAPLIAKPVTLGLSFVVTALFLFAADPFARKSPVGGYRSALIIGLAQTLALFPGISRSGTTMASARLLGWEGGAAMRFSFLLAIPAILGSLFVALIKGLHGPAIPLSSYFAALTTSFASGIAALSIVTKLLAHNRLGPFGWYCLTLGVGSLIFLTR